jgi:hypothetical protein
MAVMQIRKEMSNLMDPVVCIYIWLWQMYVAIASSNSMEDSSYFIINCQS